MLEEVAAGAVDFAQEIDEAAPSSALGGGFDQHGAGAIAEQDAGGAVGVVDDAAHGVGADHQHLLMRAGGHQVGAGGEAVDEAGAGGDQVEAPGAARAERVLHQAGGGGEEHVRRDGADDDGVDVGGANAALGERATGGFDGHVGGGHFGGGDVALADAGALDDPLVVGLDHLFEVLVGEHARRDIAAERGDFRLWRHS